MERLEVRGGGGGGGGGGAGTGTVIAGGFIPGGGAVRV